MEPVVCEVVEVPLRAVGEDAGVALRQGFRPALHVAEQLFFGLLAHSNSAQVTLDLDRGEAGLDVDAPAATDLCLKLDNIEVALAQVEAAVEQQSLDVGLLVGLRLRRAGSKATDKCP